MIRKNLWSFACALFVWVFGVSFYLLSYSVPILKDPVLQSNIVLALAIIPGAGLGTYLFYKYSSMKPSSLALTIVLVAVFLDALITVPVFVIPNGGSYSAFFGDPVFYILAVEIYFLVLYFGQYQIKRMEA